MTKAGPFSLRKPTFLLETGRSTGMVARQSGRTCARSLPHRMPPLKFLAPPSSARSTRRVRIPFWARRMAAAQPANPAPTTMHWNWFALPWDRGVLNGPSPGGGDRGAVYEADSTDPLADRKDSPPAPRRAMAALTGIGRANPLNQAAFGWI